MKLDIAILFASELPYCFEVLQAELPDRSSEPTLCSRFEKYCESQCGFMGNMENFRCPFPNPYKVITEWDIKTLRAAKVPYRLHAPRTEFSDRSSKAFRNPFGKHCHFLHSP